jgi:hypothetical protein
MILSYNFPNPYAPKPYQRHTRTTLGGDGASNEYAFLAVF